MKKTFILFGIIILSALTGLSVTGCDTGTGNESAQIQIPVSSDFKITGLTHVYDGSPKQISITPKQGKSGGAITVWYDGTGGAPSEPGAYNVTFDVAGSAGFDAVYGLSAGKLSIVVSGSGDTTNDPLVMIVNMDLGYMPDINSGWRKILLPKINSEKKFVHLVLSDCTMAGTEFNPYYLDSTGKNKIVSIVLPDAAQSITPGISLSDPVFDHFENLVSASGANIKTIGANAFTRMDCLESVSFPQAENVGDGAFCQCIELAAADLRAATGIGEKAFYHCEALETIELPLAKNIGESAFSMSGLKEINLPSAINIEARAFQTCVDLQKISLTAITDIDTRTFYNCSDLNEIYMPLAKNIGENTFRDCYSLEKIDLPKAEYIDSQAFSGNEALKKLDLPAVKFIGDGAFSGCIALETLELPALLTFGEGAFYGCASLETVFLPAATEIGANAFYAENDPDDYDSYLTSLKSVNIPAAVNIGDRAFSHCTKLETIILDAAVNIGDGVFSNCFALETISLPSAEYIGFGGPAGEGVFVDCAALKTVNLPAAKHIDEGAFKNCSSLEKITLGHEAPTAGFAMFTGIETEKTITVKIPIGAIGYEPASSPFDGTVRKIPDYNEGSDDNVKPNWANGFRGGGWIDSDFFAWTLEGYTPEAGPAYINQNITLRIESAAAP